MYFLKLIFCAALIAIFGYSETEGRKVFNGVETEPNEFPFVAWLKIGKRRVHCGATLIDPLYVLTTATCATSNVIDAIVLGDHSRSTDEGTEQEFTVANIFTFDGYNETTLENDIAILELSAPADVSGAAVTVAPVLMKNDRLVDRVMAKHCRVVGWGNVVDGPSNEVGDQSDVLLRYTADVQDTSVCVAAGAPDSTVCYEPFRDPTSVTCKGDQGGALMCKRKRVWNVVGVLSSWNMGDGCLAGTKAAYKLTLFNDWINGILAL